jgi:hypothetical protein
MRDGPGSVGFVRLSFRANCAAEKLARKLGDNEFQSVLRRLDRLTQEESRATAVQTLEVIYSFINHMTVVMEGVRSHGHGSNGYIIY